MRVFLDIPELCGHRGCGKGVVGGHRENTLGSYRAAVDAGLRWVEVDARLTADGVLVAHHDPVVGDGRFVIGLSAKETDELRVMRVADLREELLPHVAVDVDSKTSLEDALRPPQRTTASLVADLVAGASPGRRMLVTSFDPSALTIARQRAPDVPLGLLTWIGFPLRKAIPAALHLGMDVVGAHVTSFGFRDVAAPRGEREASQCVGVAHAAGLQVAAWCPLPEEGDQLTVAGVDCLVVDDVPAAVAHYWQRSGTGAN